MFVTEQAKGLRKIQRKLLIVFKKLQILETNGLCTALDLCYESGVGVKKNAKKAAKWFKKAADGGDVDGMVGIARYYALGKGVNKNEQEAMKYFKKAAEEGNAESQCTLGLECRDKENNKEAVNWYTKAAEQGNCKETQFLSNKNIGRIPFIVSPKCHRVTFLTFGNEEPREETWSGDFLYHGG